MSEMRERKPGDAISEMAQRAQVALIEKFGPNGKWDRFMLGEMARTVIAALREPTDAMVRDIMMNTAAAGPNENGWGAMCYGDVQEIWRAGTDAALAD